MNDDSLDPIQPLDEETPAEDDLAIGDLPEEDDEDDVAEDFGSTDE